MADDRILADIAQNLKALVNLKVMEMVCNRRDELKTKHAGGESISLDKVGELQKKLIKTAYSDLTK